MNRRKFLTASVAGLAVAQTAISAVAQPKTKTHPFKKAVLISFPKDEVSILVATQDPNPNIALESNPGEHATKLDDYLVVKTADGINIKTKIHKELKPYFTLLSGNKTNIIGDYESNRVRVEIGSMHEHLHHIMLVASSLGEAWVTVRKEDGLIVQEWKE